MSRIERWWSEDPRRPPAEYACLMARDRFWRDPQRRLIALHPDLDGDSFYAEQLLSADALLSHALALSLSRLPVEARRGFADAFYAERRSRRPAWSHPLPPRERLARAASIALLVADLADTDGLGERVLDLLQGAAQGDDP